MAEVRPPETVNGYRYSLTCPLCRQVVDWWTQHHFTRCSYLAIRPASVVSNVLRTAYIETVQALVLANINDYPKLHKLEKAVFYVATAYKHACEVDEKHTAIGDES